MIAILSLIKAYQSHGLSLDQLKADLEAADDLHPMMDLLDGYLEFSSMEALKSASARTLECVARGSHVSAIRLVGLSGSPLEVPNETK